MIPTPENRTMSTRAIKAAVLALSMTVFASCAVIRGQESPRDYASDSAITAEVKAKMAADRDVAATAINVDTQQGMVQLSGFARSQTEKERAAQIARQAKGVKTVRNDIIVRP
jgi:osmotically-inducible protein OsmY